MSSAQNIRVLLLILLANLAGCASLRALDPPACAAPCRLVISVHDQRMALLSGTKQMATYLVSTAKEGVSEAVDSGGTPRGRHAIAEKIGADVAIGTVFIDRLPTDLIIAANTPGRWPVATRILRLSGLEYKNRTTFSRLIYLHGSPVENLLGSPASGGCIRMRSDEIVPLFEQVSVGTEIWIFEEPMEAALKLVAASDVRYADLTETAGVGVVNSIRQLCFGHGYGIEGLTYDVRAAMRWCLHGVEQNDPVSIALLGSLYEEGKGVAVSMVEARKLFERAARLGNSRGQFKLSRMLTEGRGGVKDEALAKELLELALKQGNTDAKALVQAEGK